MKEIISISSDQTRQMGISLAKTLTKGAVICLFGNLGTGKTMFTQGFASYFGIKKIISPTFILHRSYEIMGKKNIQILHHLDLYRLIKTEETSALGIPELINDQSIVVIEWAEKIKDILPKKRTEIYFEHLEGDRRKIRIHEYAD